MGDVFITSSQYSSPHKSILILPQKEASFSRKARKLNRITMINFYCENKIILFSDLTTIKLRGK